jgi:hypothetical protein
VRTFLQILRISFWMLPVQRVLTVVGVLIASVALMNSGMNYRFNLPGSTLPMLFTGVALAVIVPLLLGGAWLRMLAAPRAIQLLPHARGRLLAGAFGVAMLATLLWILAYWVSFRPAPPQYRPDAEGYLLMYMLTLMFATQSVIGIFIASRGPVWTLIALVLWTAPHLFGFDDGQRLLTRPQGIALVAVLWIAFGIWFLKVRRIGGEGWTSGRVSAAALAARMGGAPLTREQAMTRWLLGSGTPLVIGLLWTLGVAVLIGVQLAIGHDSPPRAVAAMVFGTLSLNAVVIAAMAQSAAARSRGLWLHAARHREQLYAWCERLLLQVAAAILLPFVLLGAALWLWLPERPPLPAAYLLPAIAAPGLTALWFGLLMVHRNAVVTTLVGLAIVAGWFYGVAQPLASGTAQPRWAVLAAQGALIVALRLVAAHRWRSLDWPRGGRVEPLS